ncbi:MAG TPA: GNAT family N-acetyltransferase [Gaiellaceae bacterium]
MTRDLGGGYELDDDLERIDIAAVHRFISEESYWAKGRDYGTQEQLVREATRVVGLYHDGSQIGFCRAVWVFGLPAVYLADVYVLTTHRGRGLGVQLVEEMIERGPFVDRSWILHTGDAHELYRKFGFREPDHKLMERPAPPVGAGDHLT